MAYYATNMVNAFQPVAGTTGATAVTIKNYGITVLTNTSADTYVLDAPVAGITKTLIANTSATAAIAVKFSTAAAQSVSLLSPTGTTATQINFAAGRSTLVATVVTLIGNNSTSWILASVFPQATTTPSPSIIGGSITLSTT